MSRAALRRDVSPAREASAKVVNLDTAEYELSKLFQGGDPAREGGVNWAEIDLIRPGGPTLNSARCWPTSANLGPEFTKVETNSTVRMWAFVCAHASVDALACELEGMGIQAYAAALSWSATVYV